MFKLPGFLIFFLIFLSGLICAPHITQAQQQSQIPPNSYGQWFMYFGDNKISRNFGIHSELQLRNYWLRETTEQTLARIGLNWYIDPNIMVTGGYGYIYTTPSRRYVEGSTTREHRIWQQLILRHRTPAVSIEHRYRLEQRYIENLGSGAIVWDHRIRYRLQILLHLETISPKLRPFFLAAYNELFVNPDRKISGQYFDRNRMYGALGYRVSPKLNLQLGYLNQVIGRADAQLPEFNHNLQVGIFYNPDLLKSRNVSVPTPD